MSSGAERALVMKTAARVRSWDLLDFFFGLGWCGSCLCVLHIGIGVVYIDDLAWDCWVDV